MSLNPKDKPEWLTSFLKQVNEFKLEEILASEDGKVIGTKKQSNFVLIKNFKRENFTKEIQSFAHSQGLRLDPFSPFAGGSLDQGSYRWQAVIPPVTKKSLFILRRHGFETIRLDTFVMTLEQKKNLKQMHSTGDPFLVCGASGVGKTSFLQAYLKEFKQDKRLIFLEDYEEIPLSSPYWLRLLGRKEDIEKKQSFTLDFLFKEALRLKPDGLVVGELRQEEIITFMEASHSGHLGSCGTFHAANPKDLFLRLQISFGRLGSKNVSQARKPELWLIFLEANKGAYSIKEILKPSDLKNGL